MVPVENSVVFPSKIQLRIYLLSLSRCFSGCLSKRKESKPQDTVSPCNHSSLVFGGYQQVSTEHVASMLRHTIALKRS